MLTFNEFLSELKNSTLRSYGRKAMAQINDIEGIETSRGKLTDRFKNKLRKRERGIELLRKKDIDEHMASARQFGYKAEEAEQIDEISYAKSRNAKDAAKSQLDKWGMSDEKRSKRAGQYYKFKKYGEKKDPDQAEYDNASYKGESYEQIDEISKEKKAAYVDAAKKDHYKKWTTPLADNHKTPTGKVKKSWANSPERKEMSRKLDQRRKYINKAEKDIGEDYAPLPKGETLDEPKFAKGGKRHGGNKPKGLKDPAKYTQEEIEFYDNLSDSNKAIFEQMPHEEVSAIVVAYHEDNE